MIPQALLQALADGEFHSGSELGEILGVSRTAVWKSLQKLEALGLRVETVKGRGYRLERALDLLDASRILSALPELARSMLELRVFQCTSSTNSDASAWLGSSTTDAYCVVLAEQQTAGRGRHGRVWVSPFAQNLYLSLAYELKGGVEALSGLSLVVGIALIRTLQALGVEDVALKWPNDVWMQGRKLAGVLVELQGEATSGWRVVIGIGLNVHMRDEDGQTIDQPWISLDAAKVVSRNELAARLIDTLLAVLHEFSRKGFAAFVAEWSAFDALAGSRVQMDGGRVVGVARGIDATGAFLLQPDQGELMVVNAGEVSVRPHVA